MKNVIPFPVSSPVSYSRPCAAKASAARRSVTSSREGLPFSDQEDAFIYDLICSTMLFFPIMRELRNAAACWGRSPEAVAIRANELTTGGDVGQDG